MLALSQNEINKAEELFKQALDADSGNVSAAYNYAGALVTNKKQGQAISFLKQYTKDYPKDAGLFVILGDAHFSSKQVPDAIQAYEQAYRIKPNYPGLPEKLGTTYGLVNRLEDAEEVFRLAVKNNPKDSKAMTNLANILLAQADADEAIATAKRALQVRASKELYVTLGSAYEMKRDFKNALISFQRAVDLGETRDEVKEKVSALQELLSKS